MLLRSLFFTASGFIAFLATTIPSTHLATTQPAQNLDVQIVVDEPTVSRITFDPAHPRVDMPKLRPSEAAFTQYHFDCRVRLKYEMLSQSQDAKGAWQVTARIRRLIVTTSLEDLIYLPTNSMLLLRAHEEGHREINEKIYHEMADETVRQAADDVMSETFSAIGKDADAAGQAATDMAIAKITGAFTGIVVDRASRAGNAFDDITDHGRRPIKVSKAIEQAMERSLSKSATQPTSAR